MKQFAGCRTENLHNSGINRPEIDERNSNHCKSALHRNARTKLGTLLHSEGW